MRDRDRKRGRGKKRKRMKGIILLSKVKKTGRSIKKKNRVKLLDTGHDNYSNYI